MADNNIIIKITSEADLDAAQKQLKDMESAAYDLTKQMADLKKAEAEELKALEAKIKKSQEVIAANKKYIEENQLAAKAAEQFNKAIADEEKKIEETNKAIDAARKKHKDLIMTKQDEIKANKQSITEINKQIKSYKNLQGEGGRMVLQLRAMREELQRMEDSGEFGTKAFTELAIAAAKLEDQIGDTQARIKILSSDTLGLDTVMGVQDGLAGAFYVATSAAEVFGTDMEKLQEAFYRVQAAMSAVQGIQQIANTLNKDSVVSVVAQTAASKLKEKAEARMAKTTAKKAAATVVDTAANVANTAAQTANTVATKTATKAQWSLNAAIAANPMMWLVGIILAVVAALALVGVGIGAFIHSFTDAGKAQKAFKDASKELENVQRENAVGEAERAFKRQEHIKKTTEAEEKALAEAEKRNASEVEMALIKQKYAKQAATETAKYVDDEVKRNQKEIDQLKIMVDAKKAEVAARRDGGKKQKKAMEELAEVEQQYYEAMQKTADLEQERTDAMKAEVDAANELRIARENMQREAQQANIDLMREGAAKEIAQINLNYKERLKTLQGDSMEENELRVALLEKQEKEIEAVRKKYALQAQQTAIQEQKNLLTAMSQASGTEQDYADQIKLTKEIAEAEAQAKIDALDRAAMGEDAYKAEVESIRLELNNNLRDIDNQYIAHLNENEKRKTEIAVMEAEARTNILRGNESIEEQKAAWQDYYNTRRDQITQNEAFEIEAINRSTDTAEVKEAKITEIQARYQAERENLKKDEATKFSEIDSQYLDELQRNVEKAERAAEKAQGGGKLVALEERFNAEQALYAKQQEQLDAQYAAGIISHQEYENQRWEITKATEDSIAAYREEKMQTVLDAFNMALETMQQVSDMAFGAIQDNIQAEMDALDEMYTTDAEEAKENANKKYISEKELADKKAALELKAAKYAKAQALINAAINTALAITSALTVPPPMSFISAALAGVMGAAQIAAIAAKPLAQYAKGRKGGKGEYALVGEKGAEIMYVPNGASIIPNHKINDMSAWGDYGVPTLPIPASANINQDVLNQAVVAQGMVIDYDRLGKAVAAAMPKQKQVSVNVDRSGITVQSGRDTRTYLNTKYNGSWT